MIDFKQYIDYFHGREIMYGYSFNMSRLTTIGLQFERMLVQSGLHNLEEMEQDIFPELVWQFYSNINLSEEELWSWVQGQTVSFSAALIN